MLPLDSPVIDLIFQQGAKIAAEALRQVLEGPEGTDQRTILDLDRQDPRLEMELSPSMPFRQRGERRLLIIDDSVAPMRQDPRSEFLVPHDLRPDKERLLAACAAMPVRLGRLNALGSWGSAVMVARSAVDLRAISLLSWVLDPTVDIDGKKRAGQLSQSEFESKILSYEKRLDELDEQAILANLKTATFERRDDLLVVDVLEPDGTWDIRKSIAMEMELAAVDQFSLVPGAPAARGKGAAAGQSAAASEPSPPPPAEPEKSLPPLRVDEIDGRVVLVFPRDRFDLDVAAALGKGDFEAVLVASDPVPGPVRDRIFREGADFVAPLEFLSEVFVDGKPLSRPEFERSARDLSDGVRILDVHCPRFGSVILLDLVERGRFISSSQQSLAAVVALLS